MGASEHSLGYLSDYNCPFYQITTAATVLKSHALCFIYALLSGTLTGQSYSTSYISLMEFHYLMSMQTQIPLHMGFVITTSLQC